MTHSAQPGGDETARQDGTPPDTAISKRPPSERNFLVRGVVAIGRKMSAFIGASGPRAGMRDTDPGS